MKRNYLIGLFAVALAAVGCSKDDAADNGTDNGGVYGENAYLAVNIIDATSLTRATSQDDAFEYGVDEQAVSSADFYFYDADGIFVTQASVWDGGTSNTADPAQNVEYFGNSVVFLKGLKQTNFPKYVVTVLNAPEGFVPGETLAAMETALSYASDSKAKTYDGEYRNGDKFIMSTSSFVRTDTGLPYFATEVPEASFQKEPLAAEVAKPVNIYVERLAVKVSLKVDATQGDGNALLEPVLGKDGDTYYKFKVTVAGKENAADDESDPAVGAEELYIKFLGWGLNATAKESDIVKNLDTSWTNEGLGFVWNVADYNRSYWGKSYNYGKTDGSYPETSSQAAACAYLNYVSADKLTAEIGSSLYCAENTNTSEIVSANFPSAVTSILLKAQLCSDTNGSSLNLVRYNGILYTTDAYKKYVLNSLNSRNRLDVWYKAYDDDSYHQIDENYVELKDLGDGKVCVQLTANAKQATLYMKGPGETPSTEMDTTGKENFDNTLRNFNQTNEAIGYQGGLMYYNIPIEHLNNSENSKTEEGTVIPEAKYGVVRNHHYVVTVNSLQTLGKGIYTPGEAIVPEDEENDETYYVGASINILSWKIVDQTVDL